MPAIIFPVANLTWSTCKTHTDRHVGGVCLCKRVALSVWAVRAEIANK